VVSPSISGRHDCSPIISGLHDLWPYDCSLHDVWPCILDPSSYNEPTLVYILGQYHHSCESVFVAVGASTTRIMAYHTHFFVFFRGKNSGSLSSIYSVKWEALTHIVCAWKVVCSGDSLLGVFVGSASRASCKKFASMIVCLYVARSGLVGCGFSLQFTYISHRKRQARPSEEKHATVEVLKVVGISLCW